MSNCPLTGEVCPTLTTIELGIAQGRNLCPSDSSKAALMQFSVEVLKASKCEGTEPYEEYDGDEVFNGHECGSDDAQKLLEVIAIAADVDIEGGYYTEERSLITEEL